MDSIYLILGPESALAERALTKLQAELKDQKCEVTTLFAGDTIVGDIADALAPSLFSERRALIIRDLQDLPEDNRAEITRYLEAPDQLTTLIFVHKGGVKGKALIDAIKKVKPQIIACEALKKEAEKSDFVKTLFLDLGRKASPAAVAALVGALGNCSA
jgi:DNA polymerase-3 subunit delta